MSIRIDRYVELPIPLPAIHYAENTLRNFYDQLRCSKTRQETEILVRHIRYWEAVVNACYNRDRNLPLG